MQLQDCVYRTRGRSTWVATVDLDERISITGDKTISEFIKSTATKHHGELRFRCRWILRTEETPVDPKIWRLNGSQIPMAEWHNTSHVAPVNHTAKSIVQPTKVESMGVHQALRFAPGAHLYLVPPEKAVVRHYRLTNGWTFFLEEVETFGSFEYTGIASDKLKALNISVMQRINQVFNE
ncbi:hypothetical protein KIN20_036525 [Parelaphostrongylus tenuis]|uniref:Glycosyltransferase family 92 protein n=1 Tax=Parelaphostrongylus tenuis TaxID=148309 RepID=A0AAD5RCP3_PARTN|nr:hypothetical protein KIN20_036525 [Parelaphostrongylus tenuis]